MKILRAIAFAILLLSPLPAAAQQSSPGWTFGYAPSPAEWSFWFGKKVDWQGAAYCPVSGCTFTGPLLTAPATTLGAGINIGQGVAPTTPNNGDIWMTASGLFVRFNGSTVQVSLPGSPFTITSNSPNAFVVGPNGTTNPVFNIDASVGSQSNGLNLQGTAAGNGVNLSVLSGATNESLLMSAKGTGLINFGSPFGYQTGAGVGGAITQITSRSTGVTLSKITGAITLFTAAPVVGTWVSFTVTNTLVATGDTIDLSVKSGTNTYIAVASLVGSGSFQISFESIAGTASDAPVINFTVIKGSAN